MSSRLNERGGPRRRPDKDGRLEWVRVAAPYFAAVSSLLAVLIQHQW